MTAEQAIYEAAELSPAEARAYAMADEAEQDELDARAAACAPGALDAEAA